jgi:hypothetical protein
METYMSFDANLCGPEAASLLQRAGDGLRPMPLVCPRSQDSALRQLLQRPSRDLLPNAPKPEAAHAGLWLYFGFFDESHGISQDIHNPDGSYWHGILHRMEPDAWNAGYWFRRVGSHPVFPKLAEAAQALGYETGSRWDPFAFIEACTNPQDRHLLEQVQLAEWQLLFDHCARPDSSQ